MTAPGLVRGLGVIKGLAALVALLAVVLGVPIFLVTYVGNPLPASLQWSSIVAALTTQDDGTILVSLIAILAWLGWAVFTASVLVELLALISRRRLCVRLPGLHGVQRLVSGLVLTIASLAVVTPQPSHATPAHATPAPSARPHAAQEVDRAQLDAAERDAVTTASEADRPTRQNAESSAASRAPKGKTYTVQQGDDLWTLAERFYGEGREWRRIAAANPDLLTGGPDHLETGWRLVLPADSTATGRSQVVTPGDSLSSIAESTYGDPDQWPKIYAANRFQLDDPDELSVGMRLVLPGKSASSASATPKPGVESSRDVPSGAEPRNEQEKPPTPSKQQRPDVPPSTRGNTGPTPAAAEPTQQTAEPTHATPTTAQPVEQYSPTELPNQETAGERAVGESAADPLVAGLAGVGGLLAAAVVSGTAIRRRRQLQVRPLGRRICQPTPAASLVESQLGIRQQPMGLRTLDLATRAISAHCHHTGQSLPVLEVATVTDDELLLQMSEPGLTGPDGFQIDGVTWRLAGADVDNLRSTPGLSEAVRPYPVLVTMGAIADGGQVVLDVEAAQLTSIESTDPAQAAAALAAVAVELSCSPWAEELELILVGTCAALPTALGQHNVTYAEDLDAVLDRLERRASTQRNQSSAHSVAAHRTDPDLADPWVPTILLVSRSLSAAEQRRLRQLVLTEPPASIAVVVVGLETAPCRLVLSPAPDGAADADPVARIEPHGLEIRPQLLPEPVVDAVVELVETTGRTDTAPAPWWFDDETAAEPDPPGNVTYLGRRFGGWRARDDYGDEEEGAAMERQGHTNGSPSHPMLRLLGPIELHGAAGVAPARAARQCLEYCGWLLEHPGTTSAEMGAVMGVAEGTRRSNMSRLRSWLGSDELDQPYLPDAYSGRILLHPAVSSDWQRLQILTSRGVNRTSTSGLEAALHLVRGAPMADAAPGQWHWAEGLRTDMMSAIRDIGVELTERALAESNLDLARWAASRALLVAPGDELLLVARIKTEHRAGNHSEVERLTLQLAAHARLLEVDLLPETVDVLQEMMEGRVRARLA
ncbi:MAG: LysM peptidoglycan-binding domain-containing protein [Microlunatus sp.]